MNAGAAIPLWGRFANVTSNLKDLKIAQTSLGLLVLTREPELTTDTIDV
jgi:hypothetical protein